MSQEGSTHEGSGNVELVGAGDAQLGSEGMEHEASTSDDQKMVLPVGVRDSSSRLSIFNFEKLVEDYPCISKYNPIMATPDQRAHQPPPGKITLYMSYFPISNLRLPFTPFFLKVLAYFKVGIGQMHPVSVGKIIFFEMIMTAFGLAPSLHMFRKFFRISTTGDWFMVMVRENGLPLITNPPSSLKFWRFDYFFVDATLVPPNMSTLLEWRDTSNRKEASKFNRKVNMLPAGEMINRKHYERIRRVSIPYRSYTGYEGILVLAKISQDWEGDTVPFLIKKSTKEPMSFFEGLQLDFKVFDIVKGKKDNTGEDASAPASSPLHIHDGEPFESLVFDGEDANIDFGGSTVHLQESSYVEEERDRVVANYIDSSDNSSRGATPSVATPSGQGASSGHDTALPLGGGTKRLGENLEHSPFKQPRTVSPFGLASPFAVGPSTSSSASLEAMIHDLGPIARQGYSCTDFPSSHLHQLGAGEYDDMRRFAAYRKGHVSGGHAASFMSQRSGSTIVPSPVSDFLHSIGNQFYVPPPTLKLKDDGRDPMLARAFAESIVPPLRYAEGSLLSSTQLMELHDLDALNCFISATLMKQSCRRGLEAFERLADDLHKDLGREKAVNDELRVEIEGLKSKLIERDAQLSEKDAQIDLFQKDMERVNGELAEESRAKDQLSSRVRELEGELASSIALRQEMIKKFPELFRLVFDHPHVRDVIKEFNAAAIEAGKFTACADILKKYPELPREALPPLDDACSGRLMRADAALREKAFPILETIAAHCDAPMDDILALFAPSIAA